MLASPLLTKILSGIQGYRLPMSDHDKDSDESEGIRGMVSDALTALGIENRQGEYQETDQQGDDALAEAFDPLPAALAETPEIHEINKVNTHSDGDDILVPVVPVLFEDAGEPPVDTAWEIVGEALEALQSVFSALHVRHYDMQFAYATADEDEVIYRRIAVQPALVDKYLHDSSYDLSALREEVAEADNGDDELPPVNWQQFDARSTASSGAYAGSTAAVAGACDASGAGAAAACAGGGAGAGAGAGAGGAGGAAGGGGAGGGM
jgi:hypothetical protein